MSAHGGPPRCDLARGCITCSDEGVPMTVVESLDGDGLVLCEDAGGRRAEVLTGVVGPVRAGDSLLVHAGAALVRLGPGAEGRP